MNPLPLHVVVPDGTADLWLDLLRRSGLPLRSFGDGSETAATLFLPDAAGLRSRATRTLVERLRAQGTPALVGPQWAAHLGVACERAGALGTSLRPQRGTWQSTGAPLVALRLPAVTTLDRPRSRLTTLRGPGGRTATEVVATTDHGALRRRITDALRWLAFAAGRPFVQLAHAPVGHDGTLAFRIDADGFRATATAAALDALARAGLRATWFIDVHRHVANGGLASLPAIAAAGHEIQSHGFRHYTYAGAARNTENLRRSLAVLADHGIDATAAAAPFGTWNRGFAAALRACGLAWSSEFSRAYDDVPGTFGEPDGPWQVPIHPVCPALLFAAGADERDVHDWFAAELATCLDRGEPAVFYAHPIDDLERIPGLPEGLVAAARGRLCSLWQPTLGELHTFYRDRAAATAEVTFDGNALTGHVAGPAPLRVEWQGALPLLVHGAVDVCTASVGPHRDPVLTPAPFRPRALHCDRLRTHRLRVARLLRELRS